MKGKHNLNMSFAEKDIVKFNPAFCSESERDKLYIILECYDEASWEFLSHVLAQLHNLVVVS